MGYNHIKKTMVSYEQHTFIYENNGFNADRKWINGTMFELTDRDYVKNWHWQSCIHLASYEERCSILDAKPEKQPSFITDEKKTTILEYIKLPKTV